jgi:hypothetical protein
MLKVDYTKVPVDYMVPAVKRYIENGIMPGGFLTAVICNDLRGAIFKADTANQNAIKEWVLFFEWEAPAACWGSINSVDDWVAFAEQAS